MSLVVKELECRDRLEMARVWVFEREGVWMDLAWRRWRSHRLWHLDFQDQRATCSNVTQDTSSVETLYEEGSIANIHLLALP